MNGIKFRWWNRQHNQECTDQAKHGAKIPVRPVTVSRSKTEVKCAYGDCRNREYEFWAVRKQQPCCKQAPIIGKTVSITIKPPGLDFDSGVLWKNNLRANLDNGKTNIPAKNNRKKPLETIEYIAVRAAANQTAPERLLQARHARKHDVVLVDNCLGLFPLDGRRRLAGDVEAYAVHAANFVDDSA